MTLTRVCVCAALVAAAVQAKPVRRQAPQASADGVPPRATHLGALFQALPGPARATAAQALRGLGPRAALTYDDTAYAFDSAGNLLARDGAIPRAERERREDSNHSRSRRADIPAPDRYDSNGLPIHHSRPGAPNKMYLALQGGTISGTAWGSGATYVCRPYRQDGLYRGPQTGGSASQLMISELWHRIAEDHIGFNIDVTTEMPTGWPNNMQGRDATHTGTLMFTRSTDMNGVALPHSGYGGIAYVNVWGRSDFASRYSPAWNQDYTAASAAEVGSHEGGHNLGLSHDGNSATTYQGNLASDNTQTPITFGPIMGTAYGADVSAWSKGDYFDANQLQDDLAIIEGKLGYATDDYPTTQAVTIGSGSTTIDGVIERNTDSDVFSFDLVDGTQFSLNAQSYRPRDSNTGMNLLFRLTITSGSSTLCDITAGAQESNLKPSWSTSTCSFTSAGTASYTMTVVGIASTNTRNGQPLFPKYASLGSYKIGVTTVLTNCAAGTVKAGSPPGICGCDTLDTDTDGDGTPDCNDLCDNDASKTAPGVCGCGVADTDTDGDGTPDCNDLCDNDASKTAPGVCGCGVADTDTDGDGTLDCNDLCVNDASKTAPGVCGCGVADVDTDSDGTLDCNDACPTDATRTTDVDSDGDGTLNCNDGCPTDAGKTAPGVCGCGTADTDTDGDGTPDCNDACPLDSAFTSVPTCGCPSNPIVPCVGNGVCEAGETCSSAPADCPGGTISASCGNGVCDAGEDCNNCAADCAGVLNGPPGNRYCCGDSQASSRCPLQCNAGGFQCLETGSSSINYCCGDGTCTAGAETISSCPLDCTPSPTASTTAAPPTNAPPPPPPPPPSSCFSSGTSCSADSQCCPNNGGNRRCRKGTCQ